VVVLLRAWVAEDLERVIVLSILIAFECLQTLVRGLDCDTS